MGIAELEPIIRIKLIIFLIGYLSLTFILRYFTRSYLKIEKREGFFRKYINNKHKRIHQILIGISIGLMIGAYFYETRISNGMGRIIITPLILLGFTVVTEIVRSYMQWKHSDDRKESILTLSDLIFSIILLAIAFASNLLGLFR